MTCSVPIQVPTVPILVPTLLVLSLQSWTYRYGSVVEVAEVNFGVTEV